MSCVKVGDFVKLVNIDNLYFDQNHGEDVRLELGEIYPVTEIDGKFIRLMKSDGTTEFCFLYRVELVGGEETAESLKNTILSIRQERELLLSKLKDLDAQEAEAISQLNALGFSLFEEGEVKSSPSKTMLYAEDIEEDMTDPENWKVGDMIRCVNGAGWERWIDEGEVAEMVEPLSPTLHLKTKYGLQYFGSMYYRDFKFHSRPVK